MEGEEHRGRSLRILFMAHTEGKMEAESGRYSVLWIWIHWIRIRIRIWFRIRIHGFDDKKLTKIQLRIFFISFLDQTCDFINYFLILTSWIRIQNQGPHWIRIQSGSRSSILLITPSAYLVVPEGGVGGEGGAGRRAQLLLYGGGPAVQPDVLLLYRHGHRLRPIQIFHLQNAS